MTEYKEIPLTKGKVTIVDADDYEWLSQRKWFCHSQGYAASRNPETKKIEFMHRVIMVPDEGMVVDHINRDGLDNRRINMRVCTQAENLRNSYNSFGKSQYKGVSFKPGRKKPWRARISLDGTTEILGDFSTEIEAAYAFDLRAKELQGEFAYLNNVYVEDFKPFVPRKTSSKYKGVNWCNSKKRWRAKISIDGKITHIGYFREEDDAGSAYLEKVKELEEYKLCQTTH